MSPCQREHHLQDLVDQFKSTEAIGVQINIYPQWQEDERACRTVNSSIRKTCNRYEVGSLWIIIICIYYFAHRSYTQFDPSSENADEANNYGKQIEEYLSLGFARKVTVENLINFQTMQTLDELLVISALNILRLP